MEVLTSEIRRWKTLTIKSAMLHPVNQILQACNKPARQLRAIDISIAKSWSWEPTILMMMATSWWPSGRRLWMHLSSGLFVYVETSFQVATFALLDHQLVIRTPSYHFSASQSISSIIHLLGELPVFSRSRWKYPMDNSNVSNWTPRQHNCRTTAPGSMTLMGRDNIFGILPHLRVPALTHLYLRSSLDYFQPAEIGSWIDLFLQRSSPPITLLEIRDLGLDPLVYGRFSVHCHR
ncbi:hypothetical protein BDZ97DRAFT_1945355 [Flammula alnicola]|nr:hypothetical protein BDZ97DRAFT_1945355 [Flammula alnicola]